MTRRSPLPADFEGKAFRVADALAAGVPRSRLRASDLMSPARAVRAPVTTDHPETTTEAGEDRSAPLDVAAHRAKRARKEFLARIKAFAPALLDGQFISHETALASMGCPLPRHPYSPSLHIASHRPIGMPRRKEVVGHRLQNRTPATGLSRDVPCEHPARAWRQTGTLWEIDDLVAAADFLVSPRHPLTTIAQLRAEVEEMGDVAGGKLVRALDLIRVGSESPEETHLRLVLYRAGLPEPDLQYEIFDDHGDLIARFDLAYPRYLVAAEYDGRGHAEDVTQFQKDADRWDAIRAAGWEHRRILSHHMRPDPAVTVRKVTEALLAAGWRPGDR